MQPHLPRYRLETKSIRQRIRHSVCNLRDWKRMPPEEYLRNDPPQQTDGPFRDMQIYLTPAGNTLVEEKIAPAIHAENMAFSDMTDTEQQEFLRLNKKYADSLRKYAGLIP